MSMLCSVAIGKEVGEIIFAKNVYIYFVFEQKEDEEEEEE